MSSTLSRYGKFLSWRAIPSLLLSLSALSCSTNFAQAADDIPTSLAVLHLTEVSVYPERHNHYGRIVEGRLPDGSWVEIDLDRHDDVREVQAKQRDAFPLQAISRLLPEALVNNPALPADPQVWKVEFDDDDKVEIEGYGNNHDEFKAEFSRGGTLLEMKYD